MLLFIAGYWLGKWQSHHYRRDWRRRLGRKLQLLAVRNEMKGYRLKRKRPVLARWQKCLLGWLHGITPTFTRYRLQLGITTGNYSGDLQRIT